MCSHVQQSIFANGKKTIQQQRQRRLKHSDVNVIHCGHRSQRITATILCKSADLLDALTVLLLLQWLERPSLSLYPKRCSCHVHYSSPTSAPNLQNHAVMSLLSVTETHHSVTDTDT